MGKSAPPDAAWSVGDYAAHMKRLLAALGIVRPRVIAHSFGGRVALKLLAEDGFSRALLTGCAGVVPKRGFSYRVRVGTYRLCRRLFPRFAERHFGSAEYRSLPPLQRESFKKIVNEDLTPLLPLVRVPTLYVFGEKDEQTPLYMARRLQAETPASALVCMRGCTHFCFCEQPDAFNEIAREFLLP